MFNFIKDENKEIYNWTITKLDGDKKQSLYYPNDLTVGIFNGNILLCGVIYSIVNNVCYVTFHAESPKWATKENLSKIFEIPFLEFDNCKIVKCGTSAKNKKVNKLLWGLKLRHEGHLRFGRPDGTDENVFSITYDELKNKRWYKKWAK